MASENISGNEQDYEILSANGKVTDNNIIEHLGINNMYGPFDFANNNIAELIKNNNRNLKQASSKIREMEITKDSTSRPSLTTPLISRNIDTIDINVQKRYNYEDLMISRLIRRQERQYIHHIKQNTGGYHQKHILDYKTNLFTNRLFYNISSKKLSKHEENLLALGLKFTIDNHQTTDAEFMLQIDEYHKYLCMKYDTLKYAKTYERRTERRNATSTGIC